MAAKQRTALGPTGEMLRQNIRRAREDQRLTYVGLSNRLNEIGRPIPVLGLRRIEAGERRVDADDLVALAEALSTHPVLLLLPLGHEERGEVLPGREMDIWEAVKWFAGRDRSPATDWRQSDVPTQLWEEHDDSLANWLEAMDFALEAQKRGVPTDVAVGGMKTSQAQAERSLQVIRSRMRSLGFTPPALPSELVHVDSEGGGEG
ncbi:helix-turn-helix transcriptional regulator [Streptomyces sp. NPDC046977]|uniref:helix-turn-helix domain-containing protein n=1 Tax=Streptomyces sp. NPDC046977 TaxID=3154703 RepID=UPI0033D552F7